MNIPKNVFYVWPQSALLLLYSFNCNKMSHKCTTGKTTQIQLGKKDEKVKLPSLPCYASKMHFPHFLTLSSVHSFIRHAEFQFHLKVSLRLLPRHRHFHSWMKWKLSVLNRLYGSQFKFKSVILGTLIKNIIIRPILDIKRSSFRLLVFLNFYTRPSKNTNLLDLDSF